MIAYLKGILAEKSPTRALIDVHGVGYDVLIPVSSYDRLPKVGDEAKVYTHLHVREDAHLLFGFATLEEKELFLLLISVSGIGPKSAIGIISSVHPKDFRQAILTENLAMITSLPGVGKKTAQRLVIELKEKIARQFTAESVSVSTVAPDLTEEAVMALVSLGYGKNVAEKAVARALREPSERTLSLQELIKLALRFATAA
jgi:Holliday junction DNA helicase RuvA